MNFKKRIAIIGAASLILTIISAIAWGLRIGAGFLLGICGIFFSLLVLRFALFRTMSTITNPRSASSAVILAWLVKLPITLLLLTAGALLAKAQFIAWSFSIVLVYFAIVLGAFLQKEPINESKK